MPFTTKVETVFPTRGVPGGWRDWWDEPDDHAELRAHAEAADRRQLVRADQLGRIWWEEDPDAAVCGTPHAARAVRASPEGSQPPLIRSNRW
jgi:hypothetical protein